MIQRFNRSTEDVDQAIWSALCLDFRCDIPFTLEQAGKALIRPYLGQRLLSGSKQRVENRIRQALNKFLPMTKDLIEISPNVFILPSTPESE